MTWEKVSGFNKYSIHPDGLVRHDRKNLIRKLTLNHRGYWGLTLQTDDGRVGYVELHRILALAFILNPKNKPEVNHIDGVKTNCALDNLEWNTYSENMRHAIAIGLKKIHSKVTGNQVSEIRLRYLKGEKQTHLAREFKITQANVSTICAGKSW